jgi:hypothetical protein
MKLSNRTVQILKKFVNINQSIQFRKGSEVSTLAIQKNVLARAPVTEEFPRDFAIYDLGEFVQVLDLFKDGDLTFADSHLTITSGRREARYFYADPAIITSPPTKAPDLPSTEVEFDLKKDDLQNIIQMINIYKVEDLSVVGKDGIVSICVRDRKNDTSNTFDVEVGTTDATFCFNMKSENLVGKLFVFDYHVRISKVGASMWTNTTENLEYMIALEPDSKYEGPME